MPNMNWPFDTWSSEATSFAVWIAVSNFRAGSWSTRWRVASPTLPVLACRARQPAGFAVSWFYGPLRGEFRQSPWFFLLCGSRYSTGDRLEIVGPGMADRRRSPLICRHGPRRVVRNCQGSWPKATSPRYRAPVSSIAHGRNASAILPRRGGPENQHVSTRLDGRDQVRYSSLSALLALRRPAVFSRRGAPWSILKRSTTGVVSMIG